MHGVAVGLLGERRAKMMRCLMCQPSCPIGQSTKDRKKNQGFRARHDSVENAEYFCCVNERTFLVPDVIALRPFVPAKDFETSLRFFADLGFRAYRLGDLLASMHIGPFAFLLHGRPNDDERFAANFMMHMFVEDIDAWWPRIADLDLSKRYGVKAPSAPALQPWGLVVAYVWDPSGVLWHIAKASAGTDN